MQDSGPSIVIAWQERIPDGNIELQLVVEPGCASFSKVRLLAPSILSPPSFTPMQAGSDDSQVPCDGLQDQVKFLGNLQEW